MAGPAKTNRALVKKKTKKQGPSDKQRTAAKLYLENIGKGKSLSFILKSAGYAPAVVKNPQLVTESKGFKQVLEEAGVTDHNIAKLVNAGMNANRVDTIKGKSVESDVADYAVRHKFLESAVKIKGYTPEPAKGGNTFNTQININPNDQEQKTLIDNTLDMLMDQTKRD